MTLGRFKGRATDRFRFSSGGDGAGAGVSLIDRARDLLLPGPEGQPALSQQLAQLLAGYGINLLVNGSVESWSGGTTSAPDGWTLTGASATVARNTTASQLQDGRASIDVAAALNTATDLAQSITISTTQNLRLRGRDMVFSARVRAGAADRVFLRLDDGVVTKDSRFHVGNSTFETLAVTMTLDAAATKIEASCEISSGAAITAQFDAMKLEEGATATAFTRNFFDYFLQPRKVSGTDSTTTSTITASIAGTAVQNVVLDGNQSVFIIGTASLKHSVAQTRIDFLAWRDEVTSVSVPAISVRPELANTFYGIVTIGIDIKPAAGVYRYDLAWNTAAATATQNDATITLYILPTA